MAILNLDRSDAVRLHRFLKRRMTSLGWTGLAAKRGARHPLAALLEAGEVELRSSSKESFAPSFELARTVMLAHIIQQLDRGTASGWEDRLRGLLSDAKNFESNAYELRIAAHYVERGFAVRFTPGQGNRGEALHDFDVNANGLFHVECKRLEPLPPPVVQHESVCDQLFKDFERAMVGSEGVNIAVYCEELLTEDQREPITNVVRKALKEGKVGPFLRVTGKIRVVLSQTMVPIAQGAFTKVADKLRVDLSRSGSVQTVSGRRFLVECPQVPDRTEAALSALRRATDQLPKDSPGIVFLSLTGMTKKGLGGGLAPFRRRVEDVLSRRPHVSAGILTFDELSRKGNQVHSLNKTWHVPNPLARHQATPEMLPPPPRS